MELYQNLINLHINFTGFIKLNFVIHHYFIINPIYIKLWKTFLD